MKVMGRHILLRECSKGDPSYFKTSGYFLEMSATSYDKPHATAKEGVDHLKSRGLIVTDSDAAARKIEEIGYERLRIYFLSRRDHTTTNKTFRAGTTYEDILRLYACDEEIRNICFIGVGKFELAFRNRLSEALSDAHGSHPYFEKSIFQDDKGRKESLHKILSVYTQSNDQRAKHYRLKYSEPILPPIWILKEFLTFGVSARICFTLEKSLREDIAGHFGVSSWEAFRSWVKCFVDLRNICAHHGRLFNRRFQKQPIILRSSSVPAAPQATLKALLECLDYTLDQANITGDFVGRIETVLNRYPEIKKLEVGY